MARRPLSSAGESRPQTAGGFASAAIPSMPTGGFDRDPQYTYSIEEEEEEEESDAEDLFAFLPPSTADQEKQHQEHTDGQPEDQRDYSDLFAASLPHPQTPPIYPPPPTFDPNARYPADSYAGPSGILPPISHIPVESPPSTGSQQPSTVTDGTYQMHRVDPGTTQSVSSGTRLARSSGIGSREVHVALPTPVEKSLEGFSSLGKHRSSTTADTMSASLTPSMLEQDSRDGSVK
jgi:hypothetical protein